MSKSNVINIDTRAWSPDQVARDLQRQVDEGNVKAVVVAIEYDAGTNEGWVFNWIGSKQTFNERVYLVTWFYRRIMARIFGDT